MRWQGRRQSDNVEDRRGMPARRLAVGGGLGTVVVLLVVMLLGGDPQAVLQQMQPPAGGPAADQAAGPQPVDPAQQPLKEFVSVVLADIEDVWNDLFQRQLGKKYREPKLVLYTDQVESACGFGSAAMGPFYCPGDEKVYLDLTFCEEMKTKYRAPGDFAVAYVLAHEVGHHVQKLVGYMDLVDKQRGRVSKAEQNRPVAETGTRLHRPGFLHARHLCPALEVVPLGPADRRFQAGQGPVRVVRGRAVASCGGMPSSTTGRRGRRSPGGPFWGCK